MRPRTARPAVRQQLFTTGSNAVPGAAAGKALFSAQEAENWAARGEKVILVRHETSPEDVGGMYVAQGILTATGGKTSHAAVVARGWGKCCIVGAETLEFDLGAKLIRAGGKTVHEGDWITLDGSDGSVYTGQADLIRPEPPEAF